MTQLLPYSKVIIHCAETLTLAAPEKDAEVAGSPTSPFTRDSLSSGLLAAAAPADAVTARRCLLMVKLRLCRCL